MSAAEASLGTPPRPATRSTTGAAGVAADGAPTPLRVSSRRAGLASCRPPALLAHPKLSTMTSVVVDEKRQISLALYGTMVKLGMISPARKFTVDANGRGPQG